ncbi:alpha/beta fold hydrolase [Paeniroseomonas aquatica]|uniref:alpha/beta fold hydrolase n=1 Tax=Paeniroseomonas aquatica TaxID=373043 RepID=UPI00360811D5
MSFGGMVAMAYATRHPEHPAKLILVSTEAVGTSYRKQRVALFNRLGGPEVGALAYQRFIERKSDAATMDAWIRLAMPHYTRSKPNPHVAQRAIKHPEVLRWFTRPDGEGQEFNLVPDLPRICCPILILGGEDDPMTPIESQADIAAALPSDLVRFERFARCGHGVIADAEAEAMPIIRQFIVD